jgi:hypothetical protein
MLPCPSTPWKPATTATAPPPSASRRPLDVDARDARLAVRTVRLDADLMAEERARRTPASCRASAVSAAVTCSPVATSASLSRSSGVRAGGLRERQQAVRLARHRRDDDDDVVPAAPRAPDAARDVADAVDVGDRRAAVLLDDQHEGREQDPEDT